MQIKAIGSGLVVVVILVLLVVFAENIMSDPTYKVIFNSNGGTKIEASLVKKDELVKKPEDPVKEGYEFLNWYLDDEEFDFDTKITKNITLEAKWEEEIKKYTITFDSLGGSEIEPLIVEEGKTLVNTPEPIRNGYEFIGWYYQNKKFDFKTVITKDMTLVAKWKKSKENILTYVVAFDSAGGSFVKSQEIESGRSAVMPSAPTREGYKFLGWYLDDMLYDFNSLVTEDITLIAKWEEITEEDERVNAVLSYEVTFDPNNGTSKFTEEFESGSTIKIPDDPTKEGYKFLGWYLNDQLFNFNTGITENITLMAKWEKIAEISYVVEDVSNSVVDQARIYVTLNGMKVDGIIDITSISGKVKTIEISKDGYMINKNIIASIKNIRIK